MMFPVPPMHDGVPSAFAAQQGLIARLSDPVHYPHPARHVRLIETHISWVLLAGRHAYKIKKAVNLGFLDFTSLAARRFYCEEELRLNRRLAHNLYQDVVAIGGDPHQPQIGAEPAIEYAVRMRRFSAANMMDRRLAQGLVTPIHIDCLAATLARFHSGLLPAAPDTSFGTAPAIAAPMRQNFEQLAPLLDAQQHAVLECLREASEREYAACCPCFEARRQQEFIRECHGDLHLGNIVVIGDEPTPFDGIEFNPAFRWIDVMNEIAFLVMDLRYRGRTDLAWRALNGYLEHTGDYAGLRVLRFYLAYRAVVRAKIRAIRARQPGITLLQADQSKAVCNAYLALAESCLMRPRPALIITHGLPGCGKTTVAQAQLERLGAIRIRSDVERKRLYGMASLESSRSGLDSGIYSAEATQRTYARLLELARELLEAGFPVIVDAAFLKQSERAQFRDLAEVMKLPYIILDILAEPATLRRRIWQRQQQARDASEADLAVLEKLQAAQEGFAEPELAHVVEFFNEDEAEVADFKLWKRLEEKISVY